MSYAFATRCPDGTWSPCDERQNPTLSRALEEELNPTLSRVSHALEDPAGLPGSITMRDENGEAHTLSHAAAEVLYLALLAMDSRLRPGGCYREKADELYAVLAAGHQEGIQELRKVFRLGAKSPWLTP
jgi:hypothetical protein